MKLVKTINEKEGIYELEFDTKDEALAFIENVRAEYPFGILHGTGYWSKKYILNLFANWGNEVEIKIAEDGEETTCINCGDCVDTIKPHRDSSPGMRSDKERCFFEQFWAEVVQEKELHFVENGHAYSFTDGEGGFCGRRYTIELEDGRVLNDMGIWHRGKVPKSIEHLFVKGVAK